MIDAATVASLAHEYLDHLVTRVGCRMIGTAGNEQAASTMSFAEALRLLEEQHLMIDLAEARIALARSLRAFGDASGARTELERARATFARMDARTLLDEIDHDLAVVTEEAGRAGPLSSTP